MPRLAVPGPNKGHVLTAAQQDLAAGYVALARGQAWGYLRRSSLADIDAVLSAAMLGLCQALETWESYCERNSFDPSREDYRKAYLLKRINGSILDQARTDDHMTRSDRRKAKDLRAAEDDGARTDDERAAATGLSIREVRRVQAAALVTVSLDDQDALTGGAEYAGSAVADHDADTESIAAVHGILASFLEAFGQLDAESRVVLALRYHAELEIEAIAEALRTSPERVAQLHDKGVLAVHAALLTAVSA